MAKLRSSSEKRAVYILCTQILSNVDVFGGLSGASVAERSADGPNLDAFG